MPQIDRYGRPFADAIRQNCGRGPQVAAVRVRESRFSYADGSNLPTAAAILPNRIREWPAVPVNLWHSHRMPDRLERSIRNRAAARPQRATALRRLLDFPAGRSGAMREL